MSIANIAGRLGQLAPVQYLRSKTRVLFSDKYLLVTNTGVAVSLSAVGDVLRQHYEISCKRQASLDPARTLKISSVGLLFGPVCHYWYLYLDWFLPGKTMAVVTKKVVLDQLLLTPVYITGMMVMMGWMDRKSSDTICHDLRVKGVDLFKAECAVYPAAQYLNFAFLPTRYRVLYDNTISLGFDYYYSSVMFRKEDKGEDKGIPKLQNVEQEMLTWNQDLVADDAFSNSYIM